MPVAARTLLFTLLVPGSVAGWFPCLLEPRLLHPDGPASLRIGGALVLGLGLLIYIACALSFTTSGRGTPGPWDPPRFLVRGELYRYCRNPMYWGVMLIVLGEAIFSSSTILVGYSGFLALLFHLRVVIFEEPQLRRTFGASFETYCRSVPRWLPRHRAHS